MGDSIIQHIDHIDGVNVISFLGATIGKLAALFSKDAVALEKYDYIIIHVGINNIGNFVKFKMSHRIAYNGIISDFANLIAIVQKKKPGITILVSSILPRPVDHSATDDIIKELNSCLKDTMSIDMGFKFICSYKAVSKFGTYQRYLFAKADQGLHLNTAGSNRLRSFFLRVISTVD